MHKYSVFTALLFVFYTSFTVMAEAPMHTWSVDKPLLSPSAPGTFDETAVKDAAIVFAENKWHVFYTARGQERYSMGYVSAVTLSELAEAPRYKLTQMRGRKDPYAAAPQVFFFEPQQLWYLIYQTRDSNYQPVYSTTKTISDPASWTGPYPLLKKDEKAKWIDFWVICDQETAYLFYSRNQKEQYVRTTPIENFPNGFANPVKVFSPVHEAINVFKVQGRDEYHMYYENRVVSEKDFRQFGLATAPHLLGSWKRVADDFITGVKLRWESGATPWTEEVSHGDMIRPGINQLLEYEPTNCRFLIQGMLLDKHKGDYAQLRWTMGIITQQN